MNRCDFATLSSGLTGEAGLDKRLIADFEQRIRKHYGAELDELLGALEGHETTKNLEKSVLEALGDVEGRHLVAREIIRVWFTGHVQTKYEGSEPPRTAEQWERGLLWSVIRAPAPGFSHNPHGVWASPPPQET